MAFVLFYLVVDDGSWGTGAFGMVLVVLAILLVFTSGYQSGRGELSGLERLGKTNLKILAACTNDNTVFVIGLLHDGSVKTFSYGSNGSSSNRVEVGRYHYVYNGKLTPFPREELELPPR